MKQKTLLIILATITILASCIIGYIIIDNQTTSRNVDSFEKCVAAGYPVQDSYPERCMTPDGRGFTRPTAGSDSVVSHEGTLVCLPHKDMDGPQTLECASGLKTDSGVYYALSTDQADSALISATGNNQRVRISGTLKQDTSTKYQSAGTITVTSYEFL